MQDGSKSAERTRPKWSGNNFGMCKSPFLNIALGPFLTHVGPILVGAFWVPLTRPPEPSTRQYAGLGVCLGFSEETANTRGTMYLWIGFRATWSDIWPNLGLRLFVAKMRRFVPF